MIIPTETKVSAAVKPSVLFKIEMANKETWSFRPIRKGGSYIQSPMPDRKLHFVRTQSMGQIKFEVIVSHIPIARTGVPVFLKDGFAVCFHLNTCPQEQF